MGRPRIPPAVKALRRRLRYGDASLLATAADVTPGRRAAMSADELRVFDALPDVVTVHRGTTSEQLLGLSWTLEQSVAEFFARRYGGLTYTVQVPKEAVLAYYAEYNEAEVLIDLEALPGVRPEALPPLAVGA